MEGKVIMRIVAIVQARMGSSRLPQKVMADLCGHPALWHIHDRLRHSRQVDDFVIATSGRPENKEIEAFAKRNGIHVFCGSEENVLERFYLAAKGADADVVIRLTGDNVFVRKLWMQAWLILSKRKNWITFTTGKACHWGWQWR